MRKRLMAAAAMVAATAIPFTTALAAGKAAGTPQRSTEMPRGLSNVLANGAPGIVKAIVATEGSNSRLQDRPVSP